MGDSIPFPTPFHGSAKRKCRFFPQHHGNRVNCRCNHNFVCLAEFSCLRLCAGGLKNNNNNNNNGYTQLQYVTCMCVTTITRVSAVRIPCHVAHYPTAVQKIIPVPYCTCNMT